MQFSGNVVAHRRTAAAVPDTGENAGISRPGEQESLPGIEFDLTSGVVDIAELRQLFTPPRKGFLSTWFEPSPPESFVAAFSAVGARGTVEADEIRLGRYSIADARASLDFRNRRLAISELSGSVADGKGEARAVIEFGQESSSMLLETQFEQVDLAMLLRGNTSWENLFGGRLNGDLRVQTSGSDWGEMVERLNGSGRLSGEELTLHGVDFARASSAPELPVSNGAASAEENPDTVFHSVEASIEISGGQLRLESVNWLADAPPRGRRTRSPGFSLSGTVGFDRKLDLIVRREPDSYPVHWGGNLDSPVVTPSVSAETPVGRTGVAPPLTTSPLPASPQASIRHQ
jgi:hypothetical protein